MRRIYINDDIKNIVKEYASILLGEKPELINWRAGYYPKDRLSEFGRFLDLNNYKPYALYVKRIQRDLFRIITLTPDAFDDFHNLQFAVFGEKCLNIDLNKKINYKNKHLSFYKHILWCMRCEDVCENLMRRYIKKLNIKTCIYCNAQYAITTKEYDDNGEKKRISTYQLDHYYPKSSYPYLCISFFNLHPSCFGCNQTKATKKSLFTLYSKNQLDVDVFKFILTPDKALNALVSDDMKNLAVELYSENKSLLNNHNDLFHIDLIYEQHIDVVERIIVLLRDYNEFNQQSLKESLGELFPNGVESPEYFFFGYYMDRKHIHYQPLTMLVQDIVSQLRSK